ncbi:MAG: hypothetical protein PHI37_03220 [Candidatus Gracilibacteria bacterium]|nr:hypothetical protein [Candidatus Gracilibacteria bacterium]
MENTPDNTPTQDPDNTPTQDPDNTPTQDQTLGGDYVSDYASCSRRKIIGLTLFTHIKEELEKYNDGEHIFIIHQTDEKNAIAILQSGYFGHVGLNGTSLIANLDTIINTCYFLEQGIDSAQNFQKHRGSDSLVIMIVKKSQFKDCRNLSDIDDKIGDYISSGKIDKYGLPNSCIWGYINGVSYHKNPNFTGKIGQ